MQGRTVKQIAESSRWIVRYAVDAEETALHVENVAVGTDVKLAGQKCRGGPSPNRIGLRWAKKRQQAIATPKMRK